MTRTIFTICSANYLPTAKVLLDSLHRYEAGARRILVLVERDWSKDKLDALSSLLACKILTLTQLGLPDLERMAFQYDITEFNTAVKPFVFQKLFADGANKVVYLDPDICVYHPFDAIWAALDNHLAVVTPHITAPLPDDGLVPTNENMARCGQFNFGFVGMACQESTKQFVDWWAQRLKDHCIFHPNHYYFVDQFYGALISSFVPQTLVWRHDGYNFAYWNASQRRLWKDADETLQTGDGPLVFFHFSGFTPNEPAILSKHQNRYRSAPGSSVEALAMDYENAISANRIVLEQFCEPYSFACYRDGTPIDALHRRVFRDLTDLEKDGFSDLFDRSTRGRLEQYTAIDDVGLSASGILWQFWQHQVASQDTVRHAKMLESDLRAHIKILEKNLDKEESLRKEVEAYARHLEKDMDEKETALATIQHSLGFRLGNNLLKPARRLQHYARNGKNTIVAAGKLVFRALPMSSATRTRIRSRILSSPIGTHLADKPVSSAKPHWKIIDKEAVRSEAEAELTRFLECGEVLSLPTASPPPKVTVLIVLFNQAGLSLLCLKALASIRDIVFDTIIIDNASSDRVPELLKHVQGARIIQNAENEGFLLAVNRAAAFAQGEYLLLLNNDALVFPDSLSAAAQRLDSTPLAGAVGGPILLWNGQLQEAGSIIWNDGSCLGFGREDDPDNFEYRFVRAVDYCSGAFLMIRRQLFEDLGRFDTIYCPAYYEESDLCVRLWKAGHSVIYDPKVKVRHFEFASTGISNQWAIDLQNRNRQIFLERHKDFLEEQAAPDLENILIARARLPKTRKRILFIDDRVPYPSLGSGFPRALAFVESIVADGHFVTHLPLQFPEPIDEGQPWPLPDSVEVAEHIGHSGLVRFLKQRQAYYDFIVVSRPHNIEALNQLIDATPTLCEGAEIVYDAEALFSLREIVRAEVLNNPISEKQQAEMIREELALARHADQIVTVSPNESSHYAIAGYKHVHVLGHTVETLAEGQNFPERSGFLFVGAIQSDDSPNGDSLIWFLREVWPILCAEIEHPHLDVVGLCLSDQVRTLAGSNVVIHGRVADVAPFYNQARVFIVPTRFAAGIPHKAHEAAAHGLPMVTTALIASQLGWKDEVAVGETAHAFALHCAALHSIEPLWSAKHGALLKAVRRDCSSAQFQATVRSIFSESVTTGSNA